MPRPTPAPAPRRAAAAAEAAQETQGTVRFGVLNWAILLAGLAAILAGFVLLAQGSTVAAPLLLVLGYGVVIPVGIIW